jgi:hypothetical protein
LKSSIPFPIQDNKSKNIISWSLGIMEMNALYIKGLKDTRMMTLLYLHFNSPM